MSEKGSPIIHIGLVGGTELCREVLEKTALDYGKNTVSAAILAVADPDPESPGMILAKNLKLAALADYRELYKPEHDIHLIIATTPEPGIFDEILRTKPPHIRALAYPAFDMFWRAIRVQEQRLRERSEEIETILNGIQDFILVMTPDREIVEVNQAFLDHMGYSRDEVIGRKCHQIFQKEQTHCHLAEARCPFKQSILERQVVHEVRSRVDHSGARRYIDVSVYPIWERNGKVSKFIEVSRDITARKLEEEEMTRRLEQMVEERTRQLKETHEKLLHQDKMASLGKLAASVVHEINNPIAGILNLIAIEKRILGQGAPTKERLERFTEHLELMETETRRIGKIVSNLLSFSRQTRFELKPVDLNRLVEKSVLLSANLMKLNRVKMETHLDPRLPQVLGSEDQIQQVFMNLISNALEAMEATRGGTLTIVSRYPSHNGNVKLGFRDTGIGIPPENLSRLFEPFFTTKKKGKGVGLGLSVVYGIIQEHGGSIRVESELTKGTLVEMELPIGKKPQPVRAKGETHERH